MLGKNTKKLLICVATTAAVIFETSSFAFAATYKLGNMQKYRLIETYTIKNISKNKADAYGVRGTIDLGDKIQSPYIQNISGFTSLNGTVTGDNNKYILNLPQVKVMKSGNQEVITVEETFDSGTIDYEIDKSKVTSDFSGLSNYAQYLVLTNVPADDEEIKNKAKDLTKDLSNPYDKAYKIFEFVNSHVEYDDTPEYAKKGALSALKNGKGVSQDYAQLFVALCRASGIPSRTVSGYLNKEQAKSGFIDLTSEGHMWAEFYLPNYGWTIADPTATVICNGEKKPDYSYFAKQTIPAEHIALKYDNCADKADSDVNLLYTVYSKDQPDFTNNVNVKLYNISNIVDAADDVDKAEKSKKQEDVDAAKKLVDALPASTDKISLSNRIKAVQKLINDEAQLKKATDAVIKAESSKLQSDVNLAKVLVSKLEDKRDLNSRLESVQNYINQINAAKQAVSEAEKSKKQEDVDSAGKLVNALPEGTDKTSLNNRLDSVQKVIDQLKEATEVVVKAEDSKLQDDVDAAKKLVNALPNGTDKTSLLRRLDAVQKYIDYQKKLDDAVQAVTKAESSKIQADVDLAKALVNTLPSGTDKISLNIRLDTVQKAIDQLKKAVETVIKAENSKSQDDVNSAKNLVDALPSSDDKTSLTNRIKAIQKVIDDEKEYKTQVSKATDAVAKAESSKLQSDVDSARALVNDLSLNTDKTPLNNRLDTVQKYIDNQNKLKAAEQAVTKAESSKLQADVDSAKTLVDALPDGEDKTKLSKRLDNVQVKKPDDKDTYEIKLEKANEAVTEAENSKLQTDVDSAKALVNALPDNEDKTELSKRLDAVQSYIDQVNKNKLEQQKLKQQIDAAERAVSKAEKSKIQQDIESAENLVNALPDDTDKKTPLLSRLADIKKAVDAENAYKAQLEKATQAVVKAENSKLQDDINAAKDLVSKLENKEDMAGLSSRLNRVQKDIDKEKNDKEKLQQQIKAAEQAVGKAESSRLQSDVNSARNLIYDLPYGQNKTALLSRLDAVQVQKNDNTKSDNTESDNGDKTKFSKAAAAVVKAEKSKSQDDIDSARNLLSELNDNDNSNLSKRLDKVQDYIDKEENSQQEMMQRRMETEEREANKTQSSKFEQDMNAAEQAVAEAENSGSQSDIDKAEAFAASLPEGTRKTSLSNRLNLVEKSMFQETGKNNGKLTELQMQHLTGYMEEALICAKKQKTQASIDRAQSKISIIPDNMPAYKANYQNKLTALIAEISEYKKTQLPKAAEAAVKAEDSKLQSDILSARMLVNALPDSKDKTSLSSRLDVVQKAIDDRNKLINATSAVVRAEDNKLSIYVDNARTLVNALPNGKNKTSLNNRLDEVQKIINNQN